MKDKSNLADQVIIALHRVIRTVDLHSRTLLESHGLTGSQALLLMSLQGGAGTMAAGRRARQAVCMAGFDRVLQGHRRHTPPRTFHRLRR